MMSLLDRLQCIEFAAVNTTLVLLLILAVLF